MGTISHGNCSSEMEELGCGRKEKLPCRVGSIIYIKYGGVVLVFPAYLSVYQSTR